MPLNALAQQWVQRGQDIEGDITEDRLGISVCMPESQVLAVGAYRNDAGGNNAGQVKVFAYSGSVWELKGAPLIGMAVNDEFGYSVSMPNATTMAVGAPYNDTAAFNAGQVRIYSWDGTQWNLKGSPINGEAEGDASGWAVTMPNVDTVAIGALKNDGNGSTPDAGHVRVYTWDGSNWVQKGLDLDGEAQGDESGSSVAMPDANTVAIGAIFNDGNGNHSGHVRVYTWDGGTWVQKGTDLNGEAPNDFSGRSVSMPNPETIAIGAMSNDGNGSGSGHVRIYDWDGSNWLQRGEDIDGANAGDAAGTAVSMPTEEMVAIGSPLNDDMGTSSGHVRLFLWNGSAWEQYGNTIVGEGELDSSGFAVHMPDLDTIAIGSPDNSDSGNFAGQVQVYTFNPIAGLEDTSLQQNIVVYPNPIEDTGYILLPNAQQIQWVLRTLDGKVLQQQKATGEKIAMDLSTVASGYYLLEVINEDHERAMVHLLKK